MEMRIEQDITEKLEEDLTSREAHKRASEIAKEKNFVEVSGHVSLIYLKGITVSDLFVFKRHKVRKCTSKEWGWYFKNVLNAKTYL